MIPIDLIDYTHSSKKIPTSYLKHTSLQKTEISSWRILSAYFLDLVVLTTITLMTIGALKISFNSFMVTSSLQEAFDGIPFSTLTINFLPLAFISYFFFSYFFNHGQTCGMIVMKNRIEMKEMNFKSSLLWAMFSSAIMMTAGLSFLFTYKWMLKKSWGEFQGHDNLYHEMMLERSFSPVNLLSMTDKNEKTQETHSKEDYRQAA